ncbi:MAG: Flp family type IVb pilin [Clostridia bacterium]|nr:Flp family type IVb pilin [Clostridia bacterium]
MMNFLRDENGQGMVEYGLILALIAIAAIAVIGGLGQKVAAIFNRAGDSFTTDGAINF